MKKITGEEEIGDGGGQKMRGDEGGRRKINWGRVRREGG